MDDERPPQEPPKLRLIKNKRGRGLTAEQYEILAQTYMGLSRRSSRSLAEATGVTKATALKAISVGWPHHGWAPLSERAKLFDAQQSAKRDAKAAKSTTEALDENLHLATRIETFRMMQGLRALAMNVAKRLNDVLDAATCNRRGKRTRVIEEVRGKKIVHRVVQEDVVDPPYLPDVATAIREMSSVVVAAAGTEQRLFVAKAPEDGRKIGGMELTDEQLTFIRENGGKLPPGVTREMLGW
jgi:hypothetical protein